MSQAASSAAADATRISGSRRIACVQFAPKHGDVQANAEKVRRLTANLTPNSLDLLVLPEMALTGYVFRDAQEIAPLIEDPRSALSLPQSSTSTKTASPSLDLAIDLARRLQTHVAIGFPCRWSDELDAYLHEEKHDVSRPVDVRAPALLDHNEAHAGIYNALLVVNDKGQLIHIARKHFGFEDDKRWGSEGPGFQTITIPALGKVSFAICMDLNPYDFRAPFDDYELAQYCVREGVDVLVVSMAWLGEKLPAAVPKDEDNLQGGPNAETVNYWAQRLMPYISQEYRAGITSSDATSPRLPFTFVACNRTGTENLSRFAGSSCAITFAAHDGESDATAKESAPPPPPRLLGVMGREEGVIVIDV